MFIECPRCRNNAALQMTVNGRTHAKCLECGEEISVRVDSRDALLAIKDVTASHPEQTSLGPAGPHSLVTPFSERTAASSAAVPL